MEEEITTDYAAGTTEEITLHDGSVIRLNKAQQDMDVHDRHVAMNAVQEAMKKGEILTGFLCRYRPRICTIFLTLRLSR